MITGLGYSNGRFRSGKVNPRGKKSQGKRGSGKQ